MRNRRFQVRQRRHRQRLTRQATFAPACWAYPPTMRRRMTIYEDDTAAVNRFLRGEPTPSAAPEDDEDVDFNVIEVDA